MAMRSCPGRAAPDVDRGLVLLLCLLPAIGLSRVHNIGGSARKADTEVRGQLVRLGRAGLAHGIVGGVHGGASGASGHFGGTFGVRSQACYFSEFPAQIHSQATGVKSLCNSITMQKTSI